MRQFHQLLWLRQVQLLSNGLADGRSFTQKSAQTLAVGVLRNNEKRGFLERDGHDARRGERAIAVIVIVVGRVAVEQEELGSCTIAICLLLLADDEAVVICIIVVIVEGAGLVPERVAAEALPRFEDTHFLEETHVVGEELLAELSTAFKQLFVTRVTVEVEHLPHFFAVALLLLLLLLL